MLNQQAQSFPSHGRGHRFNPYSAHHFTGFSSASLRTSRHNREQSRTPRRVQRVEDVHAPSLPIAALYVAKVH